MQFERGVTAGFVGLLLACWALVGAPAQASNWFGATGDGSGCLAPNITDDRAVSFSSIDTATDVSNAVNWVRSNVVSPTLLSETYDSTPGSDTDVLVRDQYYDSHCEAELGVQWTDDGVSGLMGYMQCDAVQPNSRCRQATVRISNYFIDEATQTYDRRILCHEIGHAIGLAHRQSPDGIGCMTDDLTPGTNEYTPHDQNHFSVL